MGIKGDELVVCKLSSTEGRTLIADELVVPDAKFV